MPMRDLQEWMPATPRHVGTWRGIYQYVNADGQEIDRHESEVICECPEDGPFAYVQTSRFFKASGLEEHKFPGILRDGQLWWDTERLIGRAWETPYEANSTYLSFEFKKLPGVMLHEMIQINAANNRRARTWQWLRDGEIYQRTLIREWRVA